MHWIPEVKCNVWDVMLALLLMTTESGQHTMNYKTARTQVGASGLLTAQESPGNLLRALRRDFSLVMGTLQGEASLNKTVLDRLDSDAAQTGAVSQDAVENLRAASAALGSEDAKVDVQVDAQADQRELNQVYGYGAPAFADKTKFTAALAWFHSFAESHGIEYALAYGTQLGQLRHPSECFIPYDHDMDVFVGPEAAEILAKLAHDDDHYVAFTGSDCRQMGSDENHVLLYKQYNLPQNNAARKRYNCAGQLVKEQVDRCSFNGPLARVLFGSNSFLDLFIWYKSDGPAPSEDRKSVV